MAVQELTTKTIIKHDIKSPNFKPPEPKRVKEEVNGNLKENFEEDVYGEVKHSYKPDPNGNLQIEQLMGKVLNKLDNIPGESQTGTNAIEVDIQREIAIGKVDASAVKSEEIKGKVNNKLDKLKALRNRRK